MTLWLQDGGARTMGQQRQRRETGAMNQKQKRPPRGAQRDRGPRPLAPRPGAAGAQQQPFFPDLVLTFLLPSLLFFSFLDFLVVTASAAASTVASTFATADATTGGAPPMAMASAWISSSVTATPDMIFWNISGEMFMRCGSAGAA